jgi:ligand-binding sensor protein/AraC-like DNA-binding protein
MNNYFFNLRDITNQKKWMLIQQSMADVTGLAIITVDYKGTPVTEHSNCQKFCEIMRGDPETAKYCQKCDSRGGLEAVMQNKPYVYLCHANILDFAIPIIIEDKYIGSVMAGQILLPEAESKYNLEKIVHDPLLDERFMGNTHLWEYYKMLPVYSMDQIEKTMRMIENISMYIVEEAMIKNALFEINRRLLNVDMIHRDASLSDLRKQIRLIDSMDAIDRTGERTHNPLTDMINESNLLKSQGGERAYNPLVSMAIEYIRDNTECITTLGEVARHCYVSKSYLSRLFKKETNENFSAYVIKFKIASALDQIESTEKSISEISTDLGFNDCSYFIKCFKMIKGVTPAVYRKLIKTSAGTMASEQNKMSPEQNVMTPEEPLEI